MPDNLLILVVLLLATSVVYGYFYWQRARNRAVEKAAQTPAVPARPREET